MSVVSPPFTVLVPLDGSELAEAVLPLATAIARRAAGDMALVTVPQVYGLDVAWYTAGAPDAAALVPMDELLRNARAEAARYLTATAERLRAEGLTVDTVLSEEAPPEAIVRAARTQGAALVAMVTHGRGGLDRWAFGSVADKVLQTAEVPVLLSRAAAGPVKPDLGAIAVALDGSPLAEAVLPIVQTLARSFGARVLLLHVTPEKAVPAPPAALSAGEAAYQRQAADYLSGVVARLAAEGIAGEGLLLGGDDVAQQVLERSAYRDVDLVALTTHGHGGLKRLAFGSVADRLIRHADKPVLVLRNRGAS